MVPEVVRSVAMDLRFLLLNKPNLAYVYLLRVPLIVAAVMFAFPYLATGSGAGPYIIGMYDITWEAAMCAGGAVFLLWLSLTLATNTILQAGHARFGVELPSERSRAEVRVPQFFHVGPVWRIIVIWAAIYAVGAIWFLSPLVWMADRIWSSTEESTGWVSFGAAVFGILLALGLVVAGLRLRGHAAFDGLITRLLFWTQWTPQGYRVHGRKHGEVVETHKLAFSLMAIALALFLSLGWLYPGNPITELKTLPCVILILTNLCWILSAASYLFDRWRIPLVGVVLLWALMSTYLGTSSDHVYPLRQCPNDCKPTIKAGDILNPNAGPPVILVATSGGGILASAWTARVLGELERANPGRFTNSVKLLSGVSGGSVGTMYFIQHLRTDAVLNQESLFEDAARSSLDAVAWGLTYSDTLRTFGPYRAFVGQERDRGEALRKAWTRKPNQGLETGLSSWQAGQKTASGGKLPAVIFNSTIGETGERFLFANYAVETPHRVVPGMKDFFSTFPAKTDIDVPVAVANSAAFPYISPASRAHTDDSRFWFHLVDGGYHDNFGVASAIDFLENTGVGWELERPIMMILIEATPAKLYKDDLYKDQGWNYQWFAPVEGLIGMWQIAARARNSAALEWIPGLKVVRFVYEGGDYPTSWHLTGKQQQLIQNQFADGSWTPENKSSFLQVGEFLGNPNPALPVGKKN